eukprot:CAMPEP_0194686940 /NCGR_PEP_ID=MMETSP0295-20121207/15853_1 /TAXON_ID=39354 /ORGANISM="Heterosigma akashiwo, Strain CCMP2393" /LENGTH=152 /DNA_ID=CAMNT_0039574963 /DNA_START=392 /DNA_END=851 /DNA_ORIENTATION=+
MSPPGSSAGPLPAWLGNDPASLSSTPLLSSAEPFLFLDAAAAATSSSWELESGSGQGQPGPLPLALLLAPLCRRQDWGRYGGPWNAAAPDAVFVQQIPQMLMVLQVFDVEPREFFVEAECHPCCSLLPFAAAVAKRQPDQVHMFVFVLLEEC